MWNKIKYWFNKPDSEQAKSIKKAAKRILFVLVCFAIVLLGIAIIDEFQLTLSGSKIPSYFDSHSGFYTFLLSYISLFIASITAFFLWKSSEHTSEQIRMMKKSHEKSILPFLDISSNEICLEKFFSEDKLTVKSFNKKYSEMKPSGDIEFIIKNIGLGSSINTQIRLNEDNPNLYQNKIEIHDIGNLEKGGVIKVTIRNLSRIYNSVITEYLKIHTSDWGEAFLNENFRKTQLRKMTFSFLICYNNLEGELYLIDSKLLPKNFHLSIDKGKANTISGYKAHFSIMTEFVAITKEDVDKERNDKEKPIYRKFFNHPEIQTNENIQKFPF